MAFLPSPVLAEGIKKNFHPSDRLWTWPCRQLAWQGRTFGSFIQPMLFLCQPLPSDSTSSSRASSVISLGYPRASSGSAHRRLHSFRLPWGIVTSALPGGGPVTWGRRGFQCTAWPRQPCPLPLCLASFGGRPLGCRPRCSPCAQDAPLKQCLLSYFKKLLIMDL